MSDARCWGTIFKKIVCILLIGWHTMVLVLSKFCCILTLLSKFCHKQLPVQVLLKLICCQRLVTYCDPSDFPVKVLSQPTPCQSLVTYWNTCDFFVQSQPGQSSCQGSLTTNLLSKSCYILTHMWLFCQSLVFWLSYQSLVTYWDTCDFSVKSQPCQSPVAF